MFWLFSQNHSIGGLDMENRTRGVLATPRCWSLRSKNWMLFVACVNIDSDHHYTHLGMFDNFHDSPRMAAYFFEKAVAIHGGTTPTRIGVARLLDTAHRIFKHVASRANRLLQLAACTIPSRAKTML